MNILVMEIGIFKERLPMGGSVRVRKNDNDGGRAVIAGRI